MTEPLRDEFGGVLELGPSNTGHQPSSNNLPLRNWLDNVRSRQSAIANRQNHQSIARALADIGVLAHGTAENEDFEDLQSLLVRALDEGTLCLSPCAPLRRPVCDPLGPAEMLLGGESNDEIEPLVQAQACPTDFAVESDFVDVPVGQTVKLRASDMTDQPGQGNGTYTWSASSNKITLAAGAGPTVEVTAGQSASHPPSLGEPVIVTRSQGGCGDLSKTIHIWVKECKLYQLQTPRVIATATDDYLRKQSVTQSFEDPEELTSVNHGLFFGEDIGFSTDRPAPVWWSMGDTVDKLKPEMRDLLDEFASGDDSGMASRLFDAFLGKNSKVEIFEDADLNTAAKTHENIKAFVSRSISAPSSPLKSPGKTRIHQALEAAGWDINSASPPSDLGPPAFSRGSKAWSTMDFDNGLGVMINGIQHAVVIATDYHYNCCKDYYYIKLKYLFYDVFGLDDEDVVDVVKDALFWTGGSWVLFDKPTGILAWWQLQHQHGYPPLVTRICVEEEFKISTK